jgi:hypothetical protein
MAGWLPQHILDIDHFEGAGLSGKFPLEIGVACAEY